MVQEVTASKKRSFAVPLAVILREAIDFVARNYLKETVIKHPYQPEAERFWNFPLAAIEEALVNAIYHRSYEEREPVEVRITPQELTILELSRRRPVDPPGRSADQDARSAAVTGTGASASF